MTMAPFKKTNSQREPSQQQQRKQPPLPPRTTDNDDFSARRSSRVSATRYAADNDTWVEALAVCEMPEKKKGDKKSGGGGGGGLLGKFKKSGNGSHGNNHHHGNNSNNTNSHEFSINTASATEAEIASASQRLALRPYFQSQNTGQRVWDEPPSGASTIVYASAEARKMAQAQLEEMRAAYAQAALARRREREAEERWTAGADGGGGTPRGWKRGLAARGKLFRSASTSSVGKGDRGGVVVGNGGTTASTWTSHDVPINAGVPSSILHESIALAAAHHGTNNDGFHRNLSLDSNGNSHNRNHNEMSSYEQELQMAMLLSMEIGGGSITGRGDGNNGAVSKQSRKSNKSASSSSSRKYTHNVNTTSTKSYSQPQDDYDNSSLLTREEQEQLALATALSLSEEEARKNKMKFAKPLHRPPPYQQSHRSRSSSASRSRHDEEKQRSRSSSIRRTDTRNTSTVDNAGNGHAKQSSKRPPLPTLQVKSSSKPAKLSTSSSALIASQSKTTPSSSSSQQNPKATTSSRKPPQQDQTTPAIQNQTQTRTYRPPETLPALTSSTEESSIDDEAFKIPAVHTDGSFGEFLGVREPIAPVNDKHDWNKGSVANPRRGDGCDDFGSKGSEWELEWIHEEKKAWGDGGDGRNSSSANASGGDFRQY